MEIKIIDAAQAVELETGYIIAKDGYTLADVGAEIRDMSEEETDEEGPVQLDFFADLEPVKPEGRPVFKVGDRVFFKSEDTGETGYGTVRNVCEYTVHAYDGYEVETDRPVGKETEDSLYYFRTYELSRA